MERCEGEGGQEELRIEEKSGEYIKRRHRGREVEEPERTENEPECKRAIETAREKEREIEKKREREAETLELSRRLYRCAWQSFASGSP